MDHVTQLVQRAEVLVLQIRLHSDRETIRDLTVEAKDCLIQAEQQAPGSGSWLLAQMCAGQGDDGRCRKWLERGARNNALPPRETVEKHPAMAPVTGEAWFQDLMRALD